MQRGIVWTFYLIIGVIGNSCIYRSYSSKREFVFINETNRTIEFTIWADLEDNESIVYWEKPRIVKILPHSRSNVFAFVNMSPPIINPIMPEKTPMLLISRSEHGASILVDSTECFLFDNSGFMLYSNYENEVLDDRHVKHIYMFTYADFEIGKPCEEEEIVEQN